MDAIREIKKLCQSVEEMDLAAMTRDDLLKHAGEMDEALTRIVDLCDAAATPEQPTTDGGPAFPRTAAYTHTAQKGMSLRDWFAGQALVGMQVNDYRSFADMAHDCYGISDACLRKRGGAE